MRRARYRGRKPRAGLTETQVFAACLGILIAIVLMTLRVNSQWCGKSCGEQIYEAVFETEDWE